MIFEAPEPRTIFRGTGAGVKDAADVAPVREDDVALVFFIFEISTER